MTARLQFFVPGEPRPWHRPRFNRKSGAVFKDKDDANYHAVVRMAAAAAMGAAGLLEPLERGVRVDIIALMTAPASASSKRRAAMLNREIAPTKRPDIDQFAKVALDAMNTVVYRDDSQVVFLSAWKLYGASPGLQVQVSEVLP